MFDNFELIIICSIFSLFCSLIKQLYDCHYYPKDLYSFLVNVILSSLNGIIVAFLLSDLIDNNLMLLGISGFGALLGLSGLRLLTKVGLGKKIIKIQVLDEPPVVEVTNEED